MSTIDSSTLTQFKSCAFTWIETLWSYFWHVFTYSFSYLIDHFSFVLLRAQPPEIVPKSTTTNIFGIRNEEEEQQDDILPAGWISKSFHRLIFNEIKSSRFDWEKFFSKICNIRWITAKKSSWICIKICGNKSSQWFVLHLFLLFILFALLDTPPTNIPTPAPSPTNKQLLPPPILSNEQPTPSKRSNVRKNQYGDEVYD